LQQLYRQHLEHLCSLYARALESTNFDAVAIHSGSLQYYFADDRSVPFQAFGHFLNWLPVNRPDQLLLISTEAAPHYFQILPQDFWHDQHIENEPWWADAWTLTRLSGIDELRGKLPTNRLCYLGENRDLAAALGLESEAVNPSQLVRYLDYHRAFKTAYELTQLRQANRLAMTGHEAAKSGFLAGRSEFDIHMAYLSACRLLEDETPYTNIVAVNEKAATLHYQFKRKAAPEKSKVLLIDAGARVNGYCSDITRTWIENGTLAVFSALRDGIENLTLQLVSKARPDTNYLSLHMAALNGITDLLLSLEICQGSKDELMTRQLPQLFMPHGVGHLLGIQVHDVGGHQQDVAGTLQSPPSHSRALRNTRKLEPDMVFTIEPGCYFIPLLLEPERNSDRGKMINWMLVDELYPLGGIRIEDNVRVTRDEPENLTRNPHPD